MAENASTVFNVHVPALFVNAIWVALRDPTLAVREKAVKTLCACVRVIEKHETIWHVQWYVYFSDPCSFQKMSLTFYQYVKECISHKFLDLRHLLLNW